MITAAQQGDRIRAIIVEDNFILADSLRMFLQSCDVTVVDIAGDVSSGLSLVERAEFDVAVLDIRLGIETVADVARRIQDAGTPIIYLSGYADADLLPEDLRDHPCLGKPFTPEDLLDTIRTVFGRTT